MEITAEIKTECSNKIAKAMNLLSVQQPALMIYLGIVEMTPVNNPNITMRLSTRRTGTDAYLEYNPLFINTINEESVLAYLLFVEGMRLALHHCTERLQNPSELHKKASDLICCEDRSVLSISREVVKEILPDIPEFAKELPALQAMGFKKETDYYLEKLIAYFRKMNEEDEQSQGPAGDGQQPDDGEGNSAGEGENAEGSDNSGNGNGEDNGNGENESQSDISDCSNFKDMNDALRKHFNNKNREMTAEWGENTSVDESIRKATEVLNNSPEMWGNTSEGLRALITVANIPKYDPSKDLRRFKAMIMSQNTYQSRSKVNKKNPDLCGWRHENETKLLECIDSSGSMSDESVAMGEAFINLFIKHASVDYTFWDTEMYDIVPRGKKKIKINENVEVQGRGGTDPTCIIRKLETLSGRKHKYGGLIVFTDCGFDWPDPGAKWRNKILIISTTSKEHAPEWARSRGRVIALKDIIDWNERNA